MLERVQNRKFVVKKEEEVKAGHQENESMADVSEHQPEHERKRDNREQPWVCFFVTRNAIGFYDQLKRLRKLIDVEFGRNLSVSGFVQRDFEQLRFRETDVGESDLFDVFLQLFEKSPRNPNLELIKFVFFFNKNQFFGEVFVSFENQFQKIDVAEFLQKFRS